MPHRRRVQGIAGTSGHGDCGATGRLPPGRRRCASTRTVRHHGHVGVTEQRRPRLAYLGVLLFLLLGILAMHGLTSNHDAAMLPGLEHAQLVDRGAAGMAMAASRSEPGASVAETASPDSGSMGPVGLWDGRSAPDSMLLDACLAVLVGVLALGLLLAGRVVHRDVLGRMFRDRVLATKRRHRSWAATSPALSVLCVSRT